MITIKVILVKKLDNYVANNQITNKYALNLTILMKAKADWHRIRRFKNKVFVCVHRNILSTRRVGLPTTLSHAFGCKSLNI